MEENKNQEKTVNTEELKKEAVDAVNQVKDTIKNVDIKKDTKEAKGLVGSMFKNPLETIKKIAKDNTNKAFKMAIIFILIWTIAEFLDKVLTMVLSKYWTGGIVLTRILSIVKTTVAPIVSVLVLSLIIYIMNKQNKKSFITIITSIAIAKIPVVAASVVNLILLISSNASPIVNRFSSLCTVISIVLVYFSCKALYEEEQSSTFIKKFVTIYAIYYAISLVVYYLGIYI